MEYGHVLRRLPEQEGCQWGGGDDKLYEAGRRPGQASRGVDSCVGLEVMMLMPVLDDDDMAR